MNKQLSIFAFVLFCATTCVAADTSRLVRPDGKGKLVYATDERGNRLVDFSNAGYGGGGVALPSVPVRVSLLPASDKSDDGARIQAALDRVAAMPIDQHGFRGAVLLKAGTYRVKGTLSINASGVVLRGDGQLRGGTTIVATGKKKRALIQVAGQGQIREIPGTRRAIADEYVPVGARVLRLASTEGLRTGDRIVVYRPSTKLWLRDLGMDRIEGAKRQWEAGEYDFHFERAITSVSGNTITLDAPVVSAMEAKYGGGAVYRCAFSQRISRVGIEGLRLVSEFKKGKERSDEKHAKTAVAMSCVEHAWVRNVTAVHFSYSCVSVASSGKHITIQDCACLDPVSKIEGERRYSFALAGQLTLVQRCYTRRGRHDFVMQRHAHGPNVFLDCVSEKAHDDSGPHQRWSMATLYDNVTVRGNALAVQDRGKSGTGHGWTGSQTVFWNSTAEKIICQQPPTSQNFCIGCVAKHERGWHKRRDGYWESHGKAVSPRSLYLAQLEDRLGDAAVKKVTIEVQSTGDFADVLGKALSQ